MADEEPKDDPPGDANSASNAASPPPPPLPDDGPRTVTGIGDLVRRAVAAGFDAAARSKEEVVRVAAGEMRSWLDHLDLDQEIMKALSKMVVEVKSEIRFRPTDDGKFVPEAVNETKIKSTK
jgi:hypothetical protein